MIMRAITAVLLCVTLAGCAGGKMMTSIPGGEAKVFEAPKYEVLGKTQYDQNWIDSQVEGGVAAFGWQRPLPRPPELDAAGTDNRPRKAAAKHHTKKGLLHRIKKKILPKRKKVDEPIAIPVSPPAPVIAAPEPPPAPPRDPVDELLQPSK